MHLFITGSGCGVLEPTTLPCDCLPLLTAGQHLELRTGAAAAAPCCTCTAGRCQLAGTARGPHRQPGGASRSARGPTQQHPVTGGRCNKVSQSGSRRGRTGPELRFALSPYLRQQGRSTLSALADVAAMRDICDIRRGSQ